MQVQTNSVPAPISGPAGSNRPSAGGAASFGTVLASSLSTPSASIPGGSESKPAVLPAHDRSAETATKADPGLLPKLEPRLPFKFKGNGVVGRSTYLSRNPSVLRPNPQPTAKPISTAAAKTDDKSRIKRAPVADAPPPAPVSSMAPALSAAGLGVLQVSIIPVFAEPSANRGDVTAVSAALSAGGQLGNTASIGIAFAAPTVVNASTDAVAPDTLAPLKNASPQLPVSPGPPVPNALSSSPASTPVVEMAGAVTPSPIVQMTAAKLAMPQVFSVESAPMSPTEPPRPAATLPFRADSVGLHAAATVAARVQTSPLAPAAAVTTAPISAEPVAHRIASSSWADESALTSTANTVDSRAQTSPPAAVVITPYGAASTPLSKAPFTPQPASSSSITASLAVAPATNTEVTGQPALLAEPVAAVIVVPTSALPLTDRTAGPPTMLADSAVTMDKAAVTARAQILSPALGASNPQSPVLVRPGTIGAVTISAVTPTAPQRTQPSITPAQNVAAIRTSKASSDGFSPTHTVFSRTVHVAHAATPSSPTKGSQTSSGDIGRTFITRTSAETLPAAFHASEPSDGNSKRDELQAADRSIALTGKDGQASSPSTL